MVYCLSSSLLAKRNWVVSLFDCCEPCCSEHCTYATGLCFQKKFGEAAQDLVWKGRKSKHSVVLPLTKAFKRRQGHYSRGKGAGRRIWRWVVTARGTGRRKPSLSGLFKATASCRRHGRPEANPLVRVRVENQQNNIQDHNSLQEK